MQTDVLKISIKGIIPTPQGCAVFLHCAAKTFLMYVDLHTGTAISMAINGVKKERPMTHDLVSHIFQGLNIKIERVLINHVNNNTFHARLILTMKNELGTEILEIDARPSDSIVLALQNNRPIYVTQKVLDLVEDKTEMLNQILKCRD